MIRRDFEIYRYRYMDEVELHHHDFYEIYMLLRGSVSYTVENRIFHMRAGDLMLISPLELHQARVDSNDAPRCAVSWTSCAACTCRKVMAATCWPFAAWWS